MDEEKAAKVVDGELMELCSRSWSTLDDDGWNVFMCLNVSVEAAICNCFCFLECCGVECEN